VIKSSELLRILKSHGWEVYKVKGSHCFIRHPDRTGIIIVPNHGSKTLGKGLVIRIFKEAGIEWKK
jgi:predicted RNA binding protein YcfA (HicA-like mRNA interferase family)